VLPVWEGGTAPASAALSTDAPVDPAHGVAAHPTTASNGGTGAAGGKEQATRVPLGAAEGTDGVSGGVGTRLRPC
jgi:hypothetical protein